MIAIIGVILIPSTQILAGRRLPHHLPKRLQQAVFTQTHQQFVRLPQLLLVQGAAQRDIAVSEFLERMGDAGIGSEQRYKR